MASHSSIYTWKRQENKPVFSLRGNVQDWVKQVQRACDDGAKDIFGDSVCEILDRRDFCMDDDAISEGQDLIDSWIRKKNIDELLAECKIQDEVSSIQLLPGCSKELSHHEKESSSVFDLSHSNYNNDEDEVQKPAFELDDNFDEELAVHEVVYNMLERDVVDLKSVNDDKSMYKFSDPTPKMKLRHEQVKKRASQRKLAWEKANLQKMNTKTVEEEARKQLQREEKQRLDNMKREEEKIRKEMVKIRRVMQEESVQRAKQSTRVAESDEKAVKLAEDEVRKHQERKKEKLRREVEAKEKTRKTFLKQQEEEEIEKQKNLKLLKRCFSSWYALVVSKEIKCGKARALLEWRRKLRIWNAWRTYVLRSRSDRETRALTEEMKERHRKEVLADRFYCQMLFHRCLTAWIIWVDKAKEDRMLKEQHDKRAEKMATLLKAASSGQLWQDKKMEDGSGSECNAHADEELDQIKPFKLENPPQDRGNPSVPLRVTKRKENTQRQSWPHQKLQEMKLRKPKKKQNALLENIGFLTTGTKSSATSLQCPHIEDFTSREEFITAKQNKPLTSRKSVNLHSQYLRSNIVEKSESSKSVQRVVDTCENFTQAKNVSKDNVSTHEATEGSEPPQSIRSTSSTGSKSKKPPTKTLHLAMEERAKARAERKSLLDAKKRAAEQEKLAKLKQEQEEKEREILAEKQAALQKRKEEVKLAKQRELEKQQRLAEIREMNRKAGEHYHKTLLKNFGFLPWKKLISTRNERMNNAELRYKRNLQNVCFRNWLAHTRSECERRNQLASNMRKTFLLRCGLKSWKKYRNHLVEMDKVALQFARRYIVKKYIKMWQDFVIEERLLYWDRENRADEHNEKRLLRKAMKYWKKYIPLLREEEKREKRRNDLRKHVSSLLPDFQALHAHHSP